MPSLKTSRIGIIGLGYVGLPLAVEFSKKWPTLGFDKKKERIEKNRKIQTGKEKYNETLFDGFDAKDK